MARMTGCALSSAAISRWIRSKISSVSRISAQRPCTGNAVFSSRPLSRTFHGTAYVVAPIDSTTLANMIMWRTSSATSVRANCTAGVAMSRS